ncbi:hypothetical protein ACJMK2_012618 [Sinanodonta woodiana]|uniref:Serine aminopeptidase S33 domain-containing protein n=1 Tax=Sinanodonta woodiana TaxID=1069815 RepID=A0ABD3V911_SINWO
MDSNDTTVRLSLVGKTTGMLYFGMLDLSFTVVLGLVGSILISAIIYFKSIFTPREIYPQLIWKESSLTKHLVKKCHRLKQPFRASMLAPLSTMQTLLGYFLPAADVYFEREYIQMNDKGIVALDWMMNSGFKVKKYSPIIIVFPRLTGDALSVSYICLRAAMKGFRTVVFNRRGHGGSFLMTPKLSSCGDPTDIRQVIQYMRLKYPKVPIASIAIGAGCIQLFSYLGEYGSSSFLKAGVCISPSYDVQDESYDSIPKIYEILLLLSLKKTLLQNSKSLSKSIDITKALSCWTLNEFDYHVYCKPSGIDSMQAFLEKNDPMRDVDEISVPVMCINSEDDTVSCKENIPYDIFQFYPNLLLVQLEKGGHCGFLEGVPPRSWADKMAVEYVDAVLEFTQINKV